MLVNSFVVDSPNVRYDDEHITAVYECARHDVTPHLAFSSPRLCPLRWPHGASLPSCTRLHRATFLPVPHPHPSLLTHSPCRLSYATTSVEQRGADWVVSPVTTRYEFRTKRRVPKFGCAAAAPNITPFSTHLLLFQG